MIQKEVGTKLSLKQKTALVQICGWTYYNMWVGLVQILWSSQSMLLGFNGWSVLLQPFLSLKSEFIVFVETIKDSVTDSLKISKAVGIYNKLLQNSVLRFNVTVIYAPAINCCK